MDLIWASVIWLSKFLLFYIRMVYARLSERVTVMLEYINMAIR